VECSTFTTVAWPASLRVGRFSILSKAKAQVIFMMTRAFGCLDQALRAAAASEGHRSFGVFDGCRFAAQTQTTEH
jgi:hypothetical protein